MRHLLYLIFRCDFDVTESLEELNTAVDFTASLGKAELMAKAVFEVMYILQRFINANR